MQGRRQGPCEKSQLEAMWKRGQIQQAGRVADSSSRNAVRISAARTTKRLSVAAMRVSNSDRSPFGINGRDIAQTATRFLEIVTINSQLFHLRAPNAQSSVCIK